MLSGPLNATIDDQSPITYAHKRKSRCFARLNAICKTALVQCILAFMIIAIIVSAITYVIYVWWLFNEHLLSIGYIWSQTARRTSHQEIIIDWMMLECFGIFAIIIISIGVCIVITESCKTYRSEMEKFDIEMGLYNK